MEGQATSEAAKHSPTESTNEPIPDHVFQRRFLLVLSKTHVLSGKVKLLLDEWTRREYAIENSNPTDRLRQDALRREEIMLEYLGHIFTIIQETRSFLRSGENPDREHAKALSENIRQEHFASWHIEHPQQHLLELDTVLGVDPSYGEQLIPDKVTITTLKKRVFTAILYLLQEEKQRYLMKRRKRKQAK